MRTLTPTASLVAAATTAVGCINGMAGPYPCKDVDLLAHVDTNAIGGTAADMEGWTDPQTGKEWAIQGHSNGTTFIDVSNPEAPVVFAHLPPALPGVLWRELAIYNNHVYIVQEIAGAGLQIFDLAKLRTATPGTVFTPLDYTRNTSFSNAHSITINRDTGFAYVNGSNTCSAGPRQSGRLFPRHPGGRVPRPRRRVPGQGDHGRIQRGHPDDLRRHG
jgi:choice-of-anchor B domain-containing protein